MTTHEEFAALLASPEGARLEFKAARGGFHFEELLKYVVALANEGGGSIILGVDDGRPRRGSTSSFARESAWRSFLTTARAC